MSAPDLILKRKSDVVSRRVAGESILVPIRGSLADMRRIFSLNPVAEFVWERLDGVRPLSAIAQEVSGEFDAAGASVVDDVVALADDLVREGLAEKAAG